MTGLFNITEVAEFKPEDFDAINAAYEAAMAGSRLRREDHGDGTWSLFDGDRLVGCGMSTTMGAGEYLSRFGQQGDRHV